MSSNSRTSEAAKEPWNCWQVFRWLVVWKFTFFLVAFACLDLWPQWELGKYEDARHWPVKGEPNLESRFATWDAAQFLYLAQNGYRKNDPGCAYFPLFPALIRGASYAVGGNLFIAAMVLAQLFSIAGVLVFHRLTWEMLGARAADWSSIFLVAFPGAIFLSFPYTEGMFVALASLFFIFLNRDQLWQASITGMFLASADVFGICCLAPLAWHLWSHSKAPISTLSMYGPIAGFGFYLLACYLFTGNPVGGFDSQQARPFEKWNTVATAFLNFGSFHGVKDSALDRLFFVAFLGSLPFIWRLHRGLFLFALSVGAIPALLSLFRGYSRHFIMCLPVFMALGMYLQQPERRWIRWPLLVGLTSLQIFFLMRHLNFRWAG